MKNGSYSEFEDPQLTDVEEQEAEDRADTEDIPGVDEKDSSKIATVNQT